MRLRVFVAISFAFMALTGTAQTTYTWNQTNTPARVNWNTATNWTPTRSAPAADDILLFNTGPGPDSIRIKVDATQTVGAVRVTNGTNLSLSSPGRNITIGDATGTDFYIEAGSTVTLTGEPPTYSSGTLGFILSSNATAQIDGTLTLMNGSGRIFNTNSGITTVTGTINNAGAVLCTTAANLIFTSGSVYNHNQGGTVNATTGANYIPTATWAPKTTSDVGATININTPVVTATVPGNIGQSFGNFSWSFPLQSGNMNLPATVSVHGNFSVLNTQSRNLTLAGILAIPSIATVTIGSTAILVSNGNLNLLSDANGTASVAAGSSSGGYITGNVAVQRYIPGGYRKFRFFAHPFSTAINLNQWADSIDISGSVSGSNADHFTTTASGAASAFYFDETADDGATGTVNNVGWIAYASSSSSNTIGVGQGIRVLVRGSKGQAGSLDGRPAGDGTGGTYLPAPATISVKGALKEGDFSLPLSYSATHTNKGFNLVGNPYASNISWFAVYAGSANVNNAIYTYRSSSSAYSSYVNGSGTNGGSDVIESGSGFFVVANNTSAALGFTEASKTTAAPAFTTFGAQSLQDRFRLTLRDQSVTNNNDDIVMRFGVDPATDGFDAKYDAYDLPGGNVNLYALDTANTTYSIYHGSALQNSIREKREIRLGFYVSKPGSYSIDYALLEALAQGNEVFLKDKQLDTLVALTGNNTYRFAVTEVTTTGNNDRFVLVFNAASKTVSMQPQPQPEIFTVSPNPANGKIQVRFVNPAIANTSIRIIDITGKTVKLANLGQVTEGNVTLYTNGITKGTYVVQLVAGNSVKTKTIIIQ